MGHLNYKIEVFDLWPKDGLIASKMSLNQKIGYYQKALLSLEAN